MRHCKPTVCRQNYLTPFGTSRKSVMKFVVQIQHKCRLYCTKSKLTDVFAFKIIITSLKSQYFGFCLRYFSVCRQWPSVRSAWQLQSVANRFYKEDFVWLMAGHLNPGSGVLAGLSSSNRDWWSPQNAV